MKPKLIIGNWKMNTSFEEAQDLILGIEEAMENMTIETEVAICPPAIYLELATDHAKDSDLFSIGAQNCSEFEQGAYTGEISAAMLASIEVDFCIVGHSERRAYFHENADTLTKKIDQLLKNGIIPIFCCGETSTERDNNNQFQVVERQISDTLFHLDSSLFQQIVIAYEPVWAIGTGKAASHQQAQEMHQYIRNLIERQYGSETAYATYLLYGGSCNAKNAIQLFSQPDIDGGLIGGASLQIAEFMAIVEIAETVIKEN